MLDKFKMTKSMAKKKTPGAKPKPRSFDNSNWDGSKTKKNAKKPSKG